MTVSGNPYDLGPEFTSGPEGADRSLLAHCLTLVDTTGWALEFGVGKGDSLRLIARTLPVIGFDSFEGLPEDWRPNFPKGYFSDVDAPRDVVGATIVPGWFEDTVSNYEWPSHVSLIHMDADLYSSTKTVLAALANEIEPDCILVFDEFHGYDDDYTGGDGMGGPQMPGEQRAWREFCEGRDIHWSVIGHGREQWAIRITENWDV